MTKLADVLTPKRIVLDSHARSKKRVLEEICEHCTAPDEIELFYHLLIGREKLGSTALGEGVALPHCRVPTLKQSVACFIRLKEGIDFQAPDNQPVDLIFGLFVPEGAIQTHLDFLAQLAGLFSQTLFREKIKTAQNADEIYHLFTEFQNVQ